MKQVVDLISCSKRHQPVKRPQNIHFSNEIISKKVGEALDRIDELSLSLCDKQMFIEKNHRDRNPYGSQGILNIPQNHFNFLRSLVRTSSIVKREDSAARGYDKPSNGRITSKKEVPSTLQNGEVRITQEYAMETVFAPDNLNQDKLNFLKDRYVHERLHQDVEVYNENKGLSYISIFTRLFKG